MSRRIYIVLAMFIVLCGRAFPAHAQQSQQEILDTLNNTLQTLSFSRQNPSSRNENLNNSYQFAVSDNRLIITYQEEFIFFKGEEMLDKYFETGTYSAPLDLLTSAAVFPSSQMVEIAIVCNGEAKCFAQEYSGQYEKKGKITRSEDSKLLNRINLNLPENLIEPTIDLLQDLLYP